MNILYDEITGTLREDKNAIFLTVPYEEGGELLEAELTYTYRESPGEVYGDHPDVGGGRETVNLDSVEFDGSNFIGLPEKILKLAKGGKFDEYAMKAWG